jgi:transcriptional regulator with XRE-family HTH domain
VDATKDISLVVSYRANIAIRDDCHVGLGVDNTAKIDYNNGITFWEAAMIIVGERLKGLRASIGLSQKGLAEKLKISQSSVNRYENNHAEAPYKALLIYADFFDVSLDYIYGRTDQPEGKLYDFKPHIDDNEDMRLFIEMCFDPNSPMSGKLKDTLLKMMKGGE